MGIFKGRHFSYEVIIWAVRWYCKYGISYRDLEEMLCERGVEVDHSTIYRCVQSGFVAYVLTYATEPLKLQISVLYKPLAWQILKK